jgi:hypothetical protein
LPQRKATPRSLTRCQVKFGSFASLLSLILLPCQKLPALARTLALQVLAPQILALQVFALQRERLPASSLAVWCTAARCSG